MTKDEFIGKFSDKDKIEIAEKCLGMMYDQMISNDYCQVSEVEIDKHMFPSIEIIMDGTDAKFVAPYAKKTDRDTDYKTIIELMNKEDKE